MDTSPEYKKDVFESEITKIWTPQIGDFWGCSCKSCLTYNKALVITLEDTLAIDPDVDLENYYKDVKEATMTSRDCGFGIFWEHKNENPNDLGFIWLPRIDQLLCILGMSYLGHDIKSYHLQIDAIQYELTAMRASFQWFKSSLPQIDIKPSIERIILKYLVDKTRNSFASKMEYNVCETCGACDGRAGNLYRTKDVGKYECENCHRTRDSGAIMIFANLVRTDEEIKKTMAILDNKKWKIGVEMPNVTSRI